MRGLRKIAQPPMYDRLAVFDAVAKIPCLMCPFVEVEHQLTWNSVYGAYERIHMSAYTCIDILFIRSSR